MKYLIECYLSKMEVVVGNLRLLQKERERHVFGWGVLDIKRWRKLGKRMEYYSAVYLRLHKELSLLLKRELSKGVDCE